MLSSVLLLKMFDFNHTINTRLLDLAAQLTPEQWDAAQDIGRRTSLHETLFHIVTVEEEWFHFCVHGTTRFGFRKLEVLADVASLREFSDANFKSMRAYIASLDENHLQATVTGAGPGDVERTFTIWYLLLHMLFHSAQHRSEAAEMLTRFGYSPGFIDFMNHDL